MSGCSKMDNIYVNRGVDSTLWYYLRQNTLLLTLLVFIATSAYHSQVPVVPHAALSCLSLTHISTTYGQNKDDHSPVVAEYTPM